MFDIKLVLMGFSATAIIILSYILDSGMKESDMENEGTEVISIILYIVGWLILAVIIGLSDGIKSKSRLFGAFIGFFLLIVSRILSLMDENQNITIPLIIIGWVIIGLVSIVSRDGFAMMLGIIAPLLVVTSKLAILPWQKDVNMVTGPGMVMMVVGFISLVLGNAKINMAEVIPV